MPKIEPIGVYPVEAKEPVHLLEVWVRNADGVFDMGGVTQEVPEQPRSNWQAPYSEHVLSAAGDEALTEEFGAADKPDLWKGDMRLAFFFHYLDLERPLLTPFGPVQLPPASELPDRLSMIRYEPP
jgi:hypothetical protein